jgi:hypothetical protein
MLFAGLLYTRQKAQHSYDGFSLRDFIVALFIYINRMTDFTIKSVLRGAAVFFCLTAITLALNTLAEQTSPIREMS